METAPAIANRRSAYGGNPYVGPRGRRTRQQVLDAAMVVFQEKGYAAATVDDIAELVGKSRATVYQYFPGKTAIFLVLAEDLGRDLLRITHALGPLGADRAGYANLHRWVEDYFAACRRSSTMFVLWPRAAVDGGALLGNTARWIESFVSIVAGRIDDAGPSGLDTATMALVMTTVVERVSYFANRHVLGLSDDELVDTIARFLQLGLFPQSVQLFRDTLVGDVLLGNTGDRLARTTDDEAAPRAARSRRPLTEGDDPPITEGDAANALTPLRRPIGRQGRRTVELLLRTGGEVAGRQGFEQTSVDDVMTAAGLSHGAFYLYWSTMEDFVHSMAARSSAVIGAQMCSLASVDPSQASPDAVVEAIGQWLEGLWALYDEHAAIMGLWGLAKTDDPVLDEIIAADVAATEDAIAALFGRSPLRGVLDPDAVVLVLLALVTHVPYNTRWFDFWPSSTEVARSAAVIVHRGLLGAPA